MGRAAAAAGILIRWPQNPDNYGFFALRVQVM
jgi:hypothetical protein